MRKHFKVGDKVVYTGGNLKDLGERPQGVVVGFDHESSYVDFGRKGLDTHTMMGILEDMTGWICYNGHLELAKVEEAPEEVKKTFKVGDRVKSIKKGRRTSGMTGIIVYDDGEEGDNLLVDYGPEFNGHSGGGNHKSATCWWESGESLELLEEAPEEVKKTFKDPLPLIEVGGACVFNREGERVVMFVTKSQSFDIVLASRDGAHFFPAQALVMSTCGAVHHRVNYENELVGVYGLPVGNVFVFDEEVENYRPLLWSKGE